MIYNILGIIAGPLMISTGIGLLVVIGWIWSITAAIGLLWFIISIIAGIFS